MTTKGQERLKVKADNGCEYANQYLRKQGINKKAKCTECPFYPDILDKCIYEYSKLYFYLNNRLVFRRNLNIRRMYRQGAYVKDIAKIYGLKSRTIVKILRNLIVNGKPIQGIIRSKPST